MRRLTSVALLSLLAVHPAAAQFAVRTTVDPLAASPQEDKLAAPVDQCIRDNAAKVELAVSDLNQAVAFLVDNVCAQPISDEHARKTRQATEQYQRQMQDACDKEKSQPKNAKPTPGMSFCDLAGATHIGFSGIDQYTAGSVQGPPAAVALASKLLLDLRLSHSKPGQPR
jgi:hypothetical protein